MAFVKFAPLLLQLRETLLSVLPIGLADLQRFFQFTQALAHFFMLPASGLKFDLAACELASGIGNIPRKILQRRVLFVVRLFRLKHELLEFGFFHMLRFVSWRQFGNVEGNPAWPKRKSTAKTEAPSKINKILHGCNKSDTGLGAREVIAI